jgi:hypothetical protein
MPVTETMPATGLSAEQPNPAAPPTDDVHLNRLSAPTQPEAVPAATPDAIGHIDIASALTHAMEAAKPPHPGPPGSLHTARDHWLQDAKPDAVADAIVNRANVATGHTEPPALNTAADDPAAHGSPTTALDSANVNETGPAAETPPTRQAGARPPQPAGDDTPSATGQPRTKPTDPIAGAKVKPSVSPQSSGPVAAMSDAGPAAPGAPATPTTAAGSTPTEPAPTIRSDPPRQVVHRSHTVQPTTRSVMPDGTIRLHQSSGAVQQQDPDGTITFTSPDGSSLSVAARGPVVASGTVRLRATPGGGVEGTTSDGYTVAVANGNMSVRSPDGDTSGIGRDGVSWVSAMFRLPVSGLLIDQPLTVNWRSRESAAAAYGGVDPGGDVYIFNQVIPKEDAAAVLFPRGVPSSVDVVTRTGERDASDIAAVWVVRGLTLETAATMDPVLAMGPKTAPRGVLSPRATAEARAYLQKELQDQLNTFIPVLGMTVGQAHDRLPDGASIVNDQFFWKGNDGMDRRIEWGPISSDAEYQRHISQYLEHGSPLSEAIRLYVWQLKDQARQWAFAWAGVMNGGAAASGMGAVSAEVLGEVGKELLKGRLDAAVDRAIEAHPTTPQERIEIIFARPKKPLKTFHTRADFAHNDDSDDGTDGFTGQTIRYHYER